MTVLIPECLGHQREVVTRRGPVQILSHCTPEFVSQLKLDPGIGVFKAYRSILRSKEELERIAGWEDGNLILATFGEQWVVGYTACGYPGDPRRVSVPGMGTGSFTSSAPLR